MSIELNRINDERFHDLMRAAMLTSFHKYGYVKGANGQCVEKVLEKDMVAEMRYRIKRWEETGRTEYLIDIANYAMIEFMKFGSEYVATDEEGDAYKR